MVDVKESQQVLSAIEQRHRDIIKLENCIKELHNMYLELAMLVTNQVKILEMFISIISKPFFYKRVK